MMDFYDVVEDAPSTRAGYGQDPAHAIGRKSLMALPRWLLRFALPADMHDIVGRSQRVSNTRFKDATGWSLSIPD